MAKWQFSQSKQCSSFPRLCIWSEEKLSIKWDSASVNLAAPHLPHELHTLCTCMLYHRTPTSLSTRSSSGWKAQGLICSLWEILIRQSMGGGVPLLRILMQDSPQTSTTVPHITTWNTTTGVRIFWIIWMLASKTIRYWMQIRWRNCWAFVWWVLTLECKVITRR